MGRLKEHYSFPNALDRTVAINRLLADKYKFINPNQKYQSPIARSCKYIQVTYDDGVRVEEIKEFVVHEFEISDVEDPDLYASAPLLEWENSNIGKWVMGHAAEAPIWHRMADISCYGYKYQIRARFIGAAATEFLLRKAR